MPEISIIMPVYNKANYLSGILSDICNQSFCDFECIIVNDGSTDASGVICDNAAKVDSRIRVFHTSNNGVSCARNLGLELSAGNYITFIDADDHIEPDYLKQLYEDIISSHADMVIAGPLKFWEDNRRPIIPEIPYQGLQRMETLMPEFAAVQRATGIYGFCWGKMMSRDLIGDTLFSEWLRLAEDFEFYLRIYPKVETIYFDGKCKYHYLQEAENSSTIVRDDKIDYLAQLKLNLIYRNFLIKSGYWNEMNSEIVQQLLTNYAYFTVFHSKRDKVPDAVQTVHKIVVEENISTIGGTFMQRRILHYIRMDNGLRAKKLLEIYDFLRVVKHKFLRPIAE